MKVILKNVRLSFNDLFVAKSINGGAPCFGATFICSADSKIVVEGADGGKKSLGHEAMSKVCDKAAIEKWGKVPAKLENWAYNKADGSTTRGAYTNDDGEYWAGFSADTWYVTGKKREDKSKGGKIPVLDQGKAPIEANSGKIFSGCYVNAVLDVYAYEGDSGKGVSASLEAVQLLKRGEALGFTQIDAEAEFDEEDYDEEDVDLVGAGQDKEDIPF